MQAYRWTAERVLRELNSAPGGLSRKQAAARLAKHGENRLARKKGDSLWRRFMLQLSDPMILVLLAAAAVSAVLCVVHREFPADVLIIMTVVTVNAVLGVVQESKAEKAIAALQEMTPATSRVLRGGAECTVPSRTLVPGDVVLLSAGDRIPADCRVLESIGLRVEESALTGESQPVEKSAAPLPDDGQALPPSACSNLVFMGANVVYGRGRAVVIATGMDTQMGRIAHALNTAGQNATQRAIPMLEKAGLQVKVLKMRDAKDPDEFLKKYGADRFKILLEESSNRVEYQLAAIARKYDLRDDDQKVRYLQESADLIGSLPSAVQRDVYGGRVAEAAKISADAMQMEIQRAWKRRVYQEKKKQEKIDLSPARNLQPKSRDIRYTNMKSAMAEEMLLSLVLRESALLDSTGGLEAEMFSSELLGRVYAQLKQRHEQGLDVSLAGLTDLTPEEISHIAGILHRQQGPVNEQALTDCIRTIQNEYQASKVATEDDLLAVRERMKERKGMKA